MSDESLHRVYLNPEILGPEPEREERVKSRFWTTMRRAITIVPFAEDVVAAYYCALDPKTPTKVRATLLAALVYFVVPLDVIPDFLFGVGFTDDATVLLTAIGVVAAHILPVHRAAARQSLADEDAARH